MNIEDIIRKRRSNRTYTGKSLTTEDTDLIRSYISRLPQPLGGKAHIELIHVNTSEEPVKLGTYGVISNAKDFIVLLYKKGTLAEENAGYLFEQVILYCTSLGLGTCWLGGTFNRSNFADAVKMEDDELLQIVSPVGYSADKARWLDKLMRKSAGSDNRKSFENLFFDKTFATPLSPKDAGKYLKVLEMVRKAPSASNSQPWRIVKESDGCFHFYDSINKRFSPIDMGIALCHFQETCQELGIFGKFKLLSQQNISKDKRYAISWIEE